MSVDRRGTWLNHWSIVYFQCFPLGSSSIPSLDLHCFVFFSFYGVFAHFSSFTFSYSYWSWFRSLFSTKKIDHRTDFLSREGVGVVYFPVLVLIHFNLLEINADTPDLNRGFTSVLVPRRDSGICFKSIGSNSLIGIETPFNCLC